MRRRGLVAAAALLAMVLTGCGDADNDAEDGPVPDTNGGTSASDSLMDLVSALPELGREGSYVITFGDLAGLAEANGVAVPEDGDLEGLLNWAAAGKDGVPVMLPGRLQPEYLASHDEFAAELGVSLWQTGQYAGVDAPPSSVTIITGDIDSEAIETALGPADDGVWSVGGDEGTIDVSDRTAARPLGEALRIAMNGDDQLVLSSSTAMLDDVRGRRNSLSDDAQASAAIEQLRADQFVSGTIAVLPQGSGSHAVTGVGFAATADGVVARVVFGYPDDQEAADAMADVEDLYVDGSTSAGRPFADFFTVDDVFVADSAVVMDVTFSAGQSPQMLAELVRSNSQD